MSSQHGPKNGDSGDGSGAYFFSYFFTAWESVLMGFPFAELCYSFCGGTLEDGSTVLTPNMNFLYRPLPESVTLRIREDYRFGSDDPLLHPQPLIQGFEHFPLLLLPTDHPDHPLALIWLQLNDSHFVHTTQDLFVSSVRLAQPIRRAFLTLTGDLINKIESYGPAAGLSDDDVLLDLTHQVIAAFVRTRYPGTRHSVAVRFASAQRRYLELQARLDWLRTYRARLHSQATGVKPLRESRVGALVNDVEQMESFYTAGIPVWLHDTHQPSSCEIATTLPFPCYGSDAKAVVPMRGSPALPSPFSSHFPETIFQGSRSDPERYHAMYNFLKGRLKGTIWRATPTFQADRILPKLQSMLTPSGTGSAVRTSGSKGRSAPSPCE
jgi:hypothetical protein